MKQTSPQAAVARYYSRLGSRLGYQLVMRRSQHFGYYDKSHASEVAAQRKYHEEFAKLLQLQPGMKVLDAGCGQGVVASYLAKHFGAHVTGITIVPYEVKSAQKTAQKHGVRELTTFLLADYAEPPFPDASFDVIYTTETLSHAPDVTMVLRQFLRLLKPGGRLVCTEYQITVSKFTARETSLLEFTMTQGGLHGLRQFEPGQFLQTIKKVGFANAREQDWTPHVLPSFQRLRRLAKPVAAFARATHMERSFFNAVVAGGYADLTEAGKFRYLAYTARKP